MSADTCMERPQSFWLYKVAERMRMVPVLVVRAFNRATDVDWCSPGGSDNFVVLDFATGTVQG